MVLKRMRMGERILWQTKRPWSQRASQMHSATDGKRLLISVSFSLVGLG